MSSHGIVIAGGGLAAQRAAEALRRLGYDGPLRMLAAEPEPPYDRPPLSKAFLAGEHGEAALRYRDDAWYAEHAVEVSLEARAETLDAVAREVVLASGARVPFAQLLIATGSEPRTLPGTERFENVHVLRTQADARRLRTEIVPGARVAVIGAGFIGQEVASTACALGAEVTIVEAAETPLAAVLGAELGGWFARLHREQGVEVRLAARIARIHGTSAARAIELEGGERIGCDVIVVGIGTAPATGWLAGSGLEHAGGVPVDRTGRSAIPGIRVAGDAARAFDERLGAHVRTEHWEAAARQGAAAARGMLGLDVPAPPVPSFWSDQHGIRIQYVGHASGADGMTIDGDPSARDFTATFTRRDTPVAALLVGRPHALASVRRGIEHPTDPTSERTAA